MEVKENKIDYLPEMYIGTVGSTIISYIIGMNEKDRPSIETVNKKYLEFKENCKNEGFANNVKSPFDGGYIHSLIDAVGLPYVRQDRKLRYIVYINPFSYNLTFGRGLYEDDVLYCLPLRADNFFALPQESIGVCYEYSEFLEKTDEEIENACKVRREEILKREHIEEEEKTGETEGQS